MGAAPLRILLFLNILCVICAKDMQPVEDHVKTVTATEAEELKKKPSLFVVYFANGKDKPQKTLLNMFNGAFRNASNILKNYNMDLHLVNCSEETVNRTYCNRKGSSNMMYAFRYGHELQAIELDMLTSIHGIVSNVLTLAKYENFHIATDANERKEFTNRARGTRDVIFAYFSALGSREHSVFMQEAFNFTDQFEFVLTTELEAAVGLSEVDVDSKEKWFVWFLRCKHVTTGECESYRYEGRMKIYYFKESLVLWTLPSVYRIPEDGDKNIYMEQKGFVLNLQICYDNKSKELVEEVVPEVVNHYTTLLALVLVNVDLAQPGAERDLCTSHDIYPTMHLHVEGTDVFLSDFTRAEYVLNALAEQMSDNVRKDSDDEEEDDTAQQEFVDEDAMRYVMKEDDEMQAIALQLRKNKLSTPNILQLTDKTFYPTVEDASDTLVVVLFSLYYDVRSTVFLSSYAKISEKLANDSAVKLTRVECYDWTDICTKENVIAFPKIRFYKHGALLSQKPIMLDELSLMQAIEVFKHPTVTVFKSLEDVEEFEKQSLLSTSAFVLGIFDTEKDSEAFKQMAEGAVGKHVFGLVFGPLAHQLLKVVTVNEKIPYIAVLKNYDVYYPEEMVSGVGGQTAEVLTKRVDKAAQSVLPELTAQNLPALLSRSQKVIIVFGNEGDETRRVEKTMATISQAGRHSDVVFGRMSIEVNPNDDKGSLGMDILMSYEKSPTIPSLVYIDYKSGNVYSCKEFELDSEGVISTWLTGVMAGEIDPISQLKKTEWIPTSPMYDMLTPMKAMAAQRLREERNLNPMPAELVDYSSTELEPEEVDEETPVSTPIKPLEEPLTEHTETTIPQDDLSDSRLYHKVGRHPTKSHHAHTEL